MRRVIVAIIALTILMAMATGVAMADSGDFTTNDGTHCTWYGSGGLYHESCTGYDWRSSQFLNYTCDVTVFGSMASWNCRNFNGDTWHGSR